MQMVKALMMISLTIIIQINFLILLINNSKDNKLIYENFIIIK